MRIPSLCPLRRRCVFVAVAASMLLACGGKVIFDTASSGTGGIGGATSTSSATSSKAVTSSLSVQASATTGAAVTTNVAVSATSGVTSGGCSDPGPPPGSTLGVGDCGSSSSCNNATCAEVCSAIYDCGLSSCFGPPGAQLCPAFSHSAAQHDQFVSMCTPQCQATQAIKGLVMPQDCKTTITTLSAIAGTFGQICGMAGG